MKNHYTLPRIIFLFLVLSVAGWGVNASAQNTWEQLEPLSKPRMAAKSCAIGANIYVFGGWITMPNMMADGEVYNTTSGESAPIANMSAGVAFPSSDVLDDKIYLCGGFVDNNNNTNLVQEYDPEQDSWTNKMELPVGIGHQVSGVIDGKLYMAGGLHKEGSVFKETVSLVYHPEMDQWDTIASMKSTIKTATRNSGRIQASSCVYQGKLYVFGGFRFSDWGHNYLPEPEVYDPVEDTWTVLSEMILPIAHHVSIVYNDKIYLFGGTTASDYSTGQFTPSERVFEYDPATDAWQEMESMPFTSVATEGHVIDNYLYLVGGDDDSQLGGEEKGVVWKFNLDSLKVIVGLQPHQESLLLLQNQPNPFSTFTTISFELNMGAWVELLIYDMIGRKVATLLNEEQAPGRYTLTWNAVDSEPGIYFCTLKLGGSNHTMKMVKHE